jgi:hypothetical protein
MDTETVLAQIVPEVTALLKALVEQGAEGERPTLYRLEEQTQAVLPQIGQVVVQALVSAQGSGLQGPARVCRCGGSQVDPDRSRPLSVTSSLGRLPLASRSGPTLCAERVACTRCRWMSRWGWAAPGA